MQEIHDPREQTAQLTNGTMSRFRSLLCSGYISSRLPVDKALSYGYGAFPSTPFSLTRPTDRPTPPLDSNSWGHQGITRELPASSRANSGLDSPATLPRATLPRASVPMTGYSAPCTHTTWTNPRVSSHHHRGGHLGCIKRRRVVCVYLVSAQHQRTKPLHLESQSGLDEVPCLCLIRQS